MYDSVIFFNHGNLGDSILSRPFINEVKKIIKSKKYFISNKFDLSYFNDIVDGFIPLGNTSSFVWHFFDSNTNTLYFNTWFGHLINQVDSNEWQSNKSNDGILYNWENYLFFFNESLKRIDKDFNLNHMKNNKIDFIVDLPYEFNDNIPTYNDNRIKILIFNQDATSGQSDNGDFNPFIDELSKQDNVLLYTSKKTSINKENIINISDYITGPDLKIISELSKNFNVICGPGNVTVISTWNTENLSNSEKIYITANRNNIGEAIWFNEVKCQNFIVDSTESIFKKLQNLLFTK
jgi:hypothetical protein